MGTSGLFAIGISLFSRPWLSRLTLAKSSSCGCLGRQGRAERLDQRHRRRPYEPDAVREGLPEVGFAALVSPHEDGQLPGGKARVEQPNKPLDGRLKVVPLNWSTAAMWPPPRPPARWPCLADHPVRRLSFGLCLMVVPFFWNFRNATSHSQVRHRMTLRRCRTRRTHLCQSGSPSQHRPRNRRRCQLNHLGYQRYRACLTRRRCRRC